MIHIQLLSEFGVYSRLTIIGIGLTLFLSRACLRPLEVARGAVLLIVAALER